MTMTELSPLELNDIEKALLRAERDRLPLVMVNVAALRAMVRKIEADRREIDGLHAKLSKQFAEIANLKDAVDLID